MIFIQILFCSINFYVQPVLYYTPLNVKDSLGIQTRVENIFYLEFNCAIPYNELYYKEIDGKIIADCLLRFKIVNQSGTDSLYDSLSNKFTIPSFSQAAREEMVFYLQFGKYLPYDDYNWSVELVCGANKGVVKGKKSITELDYFMSDLFLASSIIRDTTGGYLTKGNLRIMPNPSGIFEEGTKNLFLYYEIYNITPDTTKLTISYMITDTSEKIIRKITKSIEKKFIQQALNLGINIETLKPGAYQLKVAIFDSLINRKLEKSISFAIRKTKEKIEITSEDLPYYDAIEYFVSSQEYNYFKTLKDEGRRLYLKRFWEKHDYNEIARRYEYADAHFQEGYLPGSKTDRGRIYIKFGPPDEIDNKQFEESKPYEYWQYYNGQEFIFVDIRGTQEYTLVWTNAPNEKSKPSLYNYLPLFKRRELGKDKE
ncbi:MAG: GWxTD domain-containing protein [candidate division WOR-3 bacterium]